MYLFIHGTGATSSFWIPQIRGILSLGGVYSDASILETFTLSLPGHIDKDKNFSLEDTEQFIKDCLETKTALQQKLATKLILTGTPSVVAGLRSEKIILTGHSVGGVIAINFAIKNQTAVEKMILVSTPNRFNSKLINFLSWFHNNIIFTRSEKSLTRLKRIVSPIRWKTALQIFIENPKRKGFKSLLKIVQQHDFEKEFTKLSLDEQLKFMSVPILAICGQNDLMARPVEVSKIGKTIDNYSSIAKSKKTIIELNSNLKTSNFEYKVYQGAGHNTMDDDLTKFVYNFREFLKI